MKTKAILVLFLISSAFTYAQGMGKSMLEVSVGGSIGGLISGKQKDLVQDSLEPKPDSLFETTLNVQAAYFPLDFLGVELGANVLGSIKANSAEVSEPLKSYKFSTYYFGFNLRKFLNERNDSCVSVGGGINYSTLEFHEDFEAVVTDPSEYLRKPDPKMGFYIKAAYNYYFAKNLFLGANVQYIRTNAVIDETDFDIDGGHLLIGASLGFAM